MTDAFSLPPLSPLRLGLPQKMARKTRVLDRYSCEFKASEPVLATAAAIEGEASGEVLGYRFTARKVGKYFRLFVWPTEEESKHSAGVMMRAKVRCIGEGQTVLVGPARLADAAGWNWCGNKPKKLQLTNAWTAVSAPFGGPSNRVATAFMLQFSADVQLDIAQLSLEPFAQGSADIILEEAEVMHRNNTLNVVAHLASRRGEDLSGIGVDLLAGSFVVQRGELQPSGGNEFVLRLQVACSSKTASQPLSLRSVDRCNQWPISFESSEEEGARRRAAHRPPPALSVAGAVEGSLGGFEIAPSGAPLITGWARDPEEAGKAVTVDLRINGLPMVTGYAATLRRDVENELDGSPVCGYRLELPHNFACGETLKAEVVVRSERNDNPIAESDFQMAPLGAVLKDPGIALNLPCRAERSGRSRSYAAIVLTQNGSEVLCEMLASLVAFEPDTFDRIVIIDHESTDNTRTIVKRFSRRLPIEVFTRKASSSFSESNNFGAAQCTEEVLVFLNNDIEFIAPVVEAMGAHLAEDVGMVGLKLLDPAIPGGNRVQHAPQHVGVHLSHHGGGKLRPFESRMLSGAPDANHQPLETPLVTAALSVMERSLFEQLGGFDEAYFYGWEDSDLCLRALEKGRTNLCVNSVRAVHVRGYSRRTMSRIFAERRARNSKIFRSEWNYSLLRRLRRGLTENLGYWTGRKLNIGFVVSEVGEDATSGDTMTALEFARAFTQEVASKAFFYDKHEAIDAQELDLLVVMTDDFDVRTVSNLGMATVLVAWARNWFQRWAIRPWRERFDHWFASSQVSADYLQAELGRGVDVMRLATNPESFNNSVEPNEFLRAEVSFTGSQWGVQRDIVNCIGALNCDVRVFGGGWESVPSMQQYASGALPYRSMPEVYRSTMLVIDDSNFVTASWASLNSRVFDALACGTLVLTNNDVGARELFGDLLPTYGDGSSLAEQVQQFLAKPAARRALVEQLRERVLQSETYAHRTKSFLETLRRKAAKGLRVAIKLAVPDIEKVEGWGDWHFACSLRRELEELGHSVRLDCMSDWQGEHTQRDDACIVLRGLERYEPASGQLNLLWLISHPDKISADELEQYDEVYVASQSFSEGLREDCEVPIFFLPQCTDDTRFYLPEPKAQRSGAVFVANSRLIMRPVAQAALDQELDMEVYGTRWEGLIPDSMVKAETVPNEQVADLYRGAGVVLNDHWDDMKRRGFVSNRLFDALACGAVVLSDEVEGLESLFGAQAQATGMMRSFSDSETFGLQLRENQEAAPSEASRLEVSQYVRANHSFAARARFIDSALRRLDAAKDRLGHMDSPASGGSVSSSSTPRNPSIWVRGTDGATHPQLSDDSQQLESLQISATSRAGY